MRMPERKPIIIAAAMACLLLAGGATSQDPDTSGSAIAITHVNLIPMDREAVIPDQTVIVQDGRIVSIGPAEAAELPEAVSLVIEGRGKYLMPGLSDMHVHPDHPDQLLLFIANGVTTIRNMHGGPRYLEWKRRIVDGELLAPSIYTTGPLIDAPPGRAPGSALVDTPEEARRAVKVQRKAGYDYIKVLGGLSQEAYDAVMDEAAMQGLEVVGHVPPAVGLDHVVRSGQLSIEHMDGIAQAAAEDDSALGDPTSPYEAWKFVDPDKVPALAEALAAQGTWVCPTLVSWQSDPMPDEIEGFLRRPEIRFVWPETIDYWRNMALPADLVQVMRDGIENRLLAVRTLHEAGARLVLGTDSPAGFVLHGFGALRELEILVEAGLTAYEAIEMATRNAAELLGASEEFGTVTEGKRADLLLLYANPLDDIGNTARQAGVMVRGGWISEEEIESMLQELATKYASEKTAAQAPSSQ